MSKEQKAQKILNHHHKNIKKQNDAIKYIYDIPINLNQTSYNTIKVWKKNVEPRAFIHCTKTSNTHGSIQRDYMQHVSYSLYHLSNSKDLALNHSTFKTYGSYPLVLVTAVLQTYLIQTRMQPLRA